MIHAQFREIQFDDIQLLRYWRNLDHVRNRMVFTGFINKQEQRKWFKEINPDLTKYFIYSLDSMDIGCVSLTKINLKEKSFEGGIFCGNIHYLKHWINIWACIRIYNLAFYDLNLDRSYAIILNDNKSALNLNTSLGYEFISNFNDNAGRYILTKEKYAHKSLKIQRYLSSFLNQSL